MHPNRALLVERYGIHEAIASLRRKDGAVLVRELANEIEFSLAPTLELSFETGIDTPKSTITPKMRVSATYPASYSQRYVWLVHPFAAIVRFWFDKYMRYQR